MTAALPCPSAILVCESNVSSIAVVSQSDSIDTWSHLGIQDIGACNPKPGRETMYTTFGFTAVEPREEEREGRHDLPR